MAVGVPSRPETVRLSLLFPSSQSLALAHCDSTGDFVTFTSWCDCCTCALDPGLCPETLAALSCFARTRRSRASGRNIWCQGKAHRVLNGSLFMCRTETDFRTGLEPWWT